MVTDKELEQEAKDNQEFRLYGQDVVSEPASIPLIWLDKKLYSCEDLEDVVWGDETILDDNFDIEFDYSEPESFRLSDFAILFFTDNTHHEVEIQKDLTNDAIDYIENLIPELD